MRENVFHIERSLGNGTCNKHDKSYKIDIINYAWNNHSLSFLGTDYWPLSFKVWGLDRTFQSRCGGWDKTSQNTEILEHSREHFGEHSRLCVYAINKPLISVLVIEFLSYNKSF